MAKRDVVFINYEKIVFLIKKIYRNNTIFCEELNKKMGTTRTTKWVSEWKRNSNLPSPKEAAVICILLKTTPDEILLHDGKAPEETQKCLEDIETVRKLVEAESAKKPPIRRPRVRMRSLRNLLPGLAGCLRSRRARCLL